MVNAANFKGDPRVNPSMRRDRAMFALKRITASSRTSRHIRYAPTAASHNSCKVEGPPDRRAACGLMLGPGGINQRQVIELLDCELVDVDGQFLDRHKSGRRESGTAGRSLRPHG